MRIEIEQKSLGILALRWRWKLISDRFACFLFKENFDQQ